MTSSALLHTSCTGCPVATSTVPQSACSVPWARSPETSHSFPAEHAALQHTFPRPHCLHLPKPSACRERGYSFPALRCTSGWRWVSSIQCYQGHRHTEGGRGREPCLVQTQCAHTLATQKPTACCGITWLLGGFCVQIGRCRMRRDLWETDPQLASLKSLYP